MLECDEVSKEDLDKLYRQRWHVELDFRNIKTTLGMDILRCKDPEMVEKELWVNLLAYNLVRLLMAQARWQLWSRLGRVHSPIWTLSANELHKIQATWPARAC